MTGISAAVLAATVKPVRITAQACVGAVISGGTSTARYRLQSNGIAQRTVAGSNTNIPNEWLASGTASQFDARGTWGGSGGTISGPTAYTNLGTTQEWSFQTSNTDGSRTLLVEIVRTGTTTPVLASATMSLGTFGSP